MFPIAQAHVERVVLVTDHAIRDGAEDVVGSRCGSSSNRAAAPRSRRCLSGAYRAGRGRACRRRRQRREHDGGQLRIAHEFGILLSQSSGSGFSFKVRPPRRHRPFNERISARGGRRLRSSRRVRASCACSLPTPTSCVASIPILPPNAGRSARIVEIVDRPLRHLDVAQRIVCACRRSTRPRLRSCTSTSLSTTMIVFENIS